MNRLFLLLVTVLAVPATAGAQTGWKNKVLDLFSAPVHPIVESVAPGGGFGPGVGLKPKMRGNEPWSIHADAVFTLPNRDWQTAASYQYTTDALHVEGYGRLRQMTQLDFYGIGADTSLEGRTTFTYDDRTVGALVSLPFNLKRTGVRLGGRIEGLFPSISEGGNEDYPSIEETFSDAQAPGLEFQPNFGAYTAFAIAQFPNDLNALARLGADLRATFTAFDEIGGDSFDFTRLQLEAQERIPGFRESDTLTLHQLYSAATTSGDARVPFYLQQTLGGVGQVRSYNDEILGSDSTKATLRGFRDLRFRGPNLLLLQAEYRIAKLVGPIDLTFFGDAGMVATQASELKLSSFRGNGGFSVSLMTIDATALRLDVGMGGGEGVHVFFSVGPIFQR